MQIYKHVVFMWYSDMAVLMGQSWLVRKQWTIRWYRRMGSDEESEKSDRTVEP